MENRRVIFASRFARENRLYVDESPFRDFSDARNRVLALHRLHAPDAWAMYIDADQVHRPLARRIASRLDRLPQKIAIVDGYERHYLQSFRWYTEIGRHILFFRLTPDLRWQGLVHEHLAGVHGDRLAIPYVFDHYGALLSVQEHAMKGRLYSPLGAPGNTADDREAAGIPAERYFSTLVRRAIRYRGSHPEAVCALSREDRERHLNDADVDRLIGRRSRSAPASETRFGRSPTATGGGGDDCSTVLKSMDISSKLLLPCMIRLSARQAGSSLGREPAKQRRSPRV